MIRSTGYAALTASMVALTMAPTTASAAQAADDAAAFVDAVSAVAPEVFDGADSLSAGPVEVVDGAFSLGEVGVDLPLSADATEDELSTGDTLLIDEEIALAPVLKEDSSVQVTFVLHDATAPTSFDFALSGVSDAELITQEDGSLLYVDADGSLLLGVAAPWALDARGERVPTHFEVAGSTLTQIVDHTQPGVSYPVVADPWLGVDLFSKVTVDTWKSQSRVNATKSAWGQAMHNPANGPAIFSTAGWNELKAKAPVVTTKGTLRQQYDCHVLGGWGNLAGAWNLEKARPTRTKHWTFGVAQHRCNWTTANAL